MSIATSLPETLLASHRNWKTTGFAAQSEDFAELGKGQSPQAMVISCCDSRVQSTEIFNVAAGTFFLHRNIANLVPPYQSEDGVGTAAALEYAVKALKVPHLIIMGHSQCGGVQACHDLCQTETAAADSGFEFVGQWLETLRPAFARIPEGAADSVVAMGHQGVLGSLENLLGYPFIKAAVAAGTLQLHGTWHDIASGTLFAYNPDTDRFEAQ
jgi:carbonic anhydrase